LNPANGDLVGPITVDPFDSNIVYAGSRHRFFKSTNGGETWTQIDTGLGDSFHVSAITIDPSDTNTIYVSGIGVFKSTNGGKNWTRINTGLLDLNVLSFAIDPSRRNVVYAGTLISGMFMSTSGGENWKQINDGIPGFGITVIGIDPSNSSTVYAATFGGSIYKREFRLPEIISAVLDTPKKLTILGRNFGNSPRVIINGSDRSDFVTETSDTSIRLKGKAKKLKLKSGDNTVQIISADGTESNVFILRI